MIARTPILAEWPLRMVRFACGSQFTSLLIAMRTWAALLVLFLTLHQPDGQEVYVAIDQIGYIGPAVQRLHPGAGTRLLVYGVEIAVRETPEEIVRSMASHFSSPSIEGAK